MKEDSIDASRRGFFRIGAGFAALALTPEPARSAQNRRAEQSGVVDRVSPPDPNRRILLKGGTIISMDSKVGDFAKGDVLIQGKKIAAVGANLQASGEVIDASSTILIP